MKVVGCIRARNESRWIERCIKSILPLCFPVLVFDDNSIDETVDIADSLSETAVIRSPFEGLDEVRDKNYLLDFARANYRPDWIVWIDGDEELTPESIPAIRDVLDGQHRCVSFAIRYLWDREDQIRVDGVYGQFARQSMFRPLPGVQFMGSAPGFHCANVPRALWGSCAYPNATLMHYGYLHREDRIRKYEWYRKHSDAETMAREDGYRHIVQGDIPEVPASAKLSHGGPLVLQSLHAHVAP